MAKVICQVHAVTHGSLEVGLDGESAYKAVFETEQVEVNAKAADLIRAIKESITQLPLLVTGRHIKGHQDDKVAFSQLDRWAQLNVNMDTAAKARLAQVRQGPPQTNIPMPHERIRVYHKGVKQSRVCKKELYQEIYGDITKQKWAQLHNIPQSLIHTGINWPALHKAMEREPLGKRRWLCKHCARQSAVGRNLKRRHHQTHSHCPRCDQDNEDSTHVLQCQHPSARVKWSLATTALCDWMIDERTHPEFREAILQRLNEWRNQEEQIPVQGSRAVREAIQCQDAIGWENFIMGRLAPQLAQFQQHSYTQQHSRRTGQSWASHLINQLWLVMWAMWEQRNEVNTTELTAQGKRERSHLLAQITQEQAKGKASLAKADRGLMAHATAMRTATNPEIKEWLKQVANARASHARNVAREHRSLRASQRLMQRWRQRGAAPVTPAPDPGH